MFVIDQENPRVIDFFDGLCRVVSRSVVDADDFEVFVCLFNEAVQAALNEGFRIVGRNDDADEVVHFFLRRVKSLSV